MADSKKKQTQSGAILNYLKEGNTITSWEAIQKFGCTRLSAKIFNYKKRGYEFVDVWEENTTRFGTTTRYKRYKMVVGE